MQELLSSIQALYDTKEQDSMEVMCGKLDLLTAKYTDLAAMCDFALPRKPGPKRTKMSNGSSSSEDELSSEDDWDHYKIQGEDAVDTSKNGSEQDDTNDDGDKDTEGGGANNGKEIIGDDSDNANEKSENQSHASDSSSDSEACTLQCKIPCVFPGAGWV